ncbi:hypothetical protein IV102_35660 [bacterium]|nr:hypothetical protein [bacterium]
MSDWQRFLRDCLPRLGAEVDWQGSSLELLAPPPLGNGDLQRYWTGEPQLCPADLAPLYPGHPLLESAQHSLLSVGQVQARHLPPSRLRKSDLPALARKAFACRNADLVVENPVPTTTPWLFFHFRVAYQWDERRVELRTVGVDSLHKTLLEPNCLEKVWLEAGPLQGDRSQLLRAYEKAQQHLQRMIEPRLQSLQREASRFQEAERSRLERYYGTLIADLNRRQGSAEKMARVEQEREVRRRDLEEKVRMKVSASLVQVELIDLPREQMRAQLRQRKQAKPLTLTYNPARHDFDPLPCEHCQSPTRTLWLCGQGHVVCDKCYGVCLECRRPQCNGCLQAPRATLCHDCRQRQTEKPTNTQTARPTEKKPTPRPPARNTEPILPRIFSDLLQRYELKDDLRLLEQPLRRNDFAGCEKLLRDFHQTINPRQGAPVRDRVRQCLEAFKEGRGDKIRQRLEQLTRPAPPTRTPPVAPAPAAVPPALSARPLEWLMQPLIPLLKPGSEEKIIHFVRTRLPKVESLDWNWQYLAVALVYLGTTMNQREVARLYRLPLASVGQCSRDVKALLSLCPSCSSASHSRR